VVEEVVTVEERESEPEAAAQVGMVRAEVPEVEAGRRKGAANG
jgi:hypothetical protein